jgi:hypothetical protein
VEQIVEGQNFVAEDALVEQASDQLIEDEESK